MITSRLVYTRYNFGNGERGGATVKRFYLFGYLVAWRTVEVWREAHIGGGWVEFSMGVGGKEDYSKRPDTVEVSP